MWINMKPYSDQMYGPKYTPYTVGISGKSTFQDQKMSAYRIWPGYHTTIHVIPKLLETTRAFNELDLNTRQCKLPHENNEFNLFKKYSRIGCEIECASRKAKSFCKCLPWHYPNNFTELPMCDIFGSYCFNEIMSNIIHYKSCKADCVEDCQETSLTLWHNTVPLKIEELCYYNTYFDKFVKKNFQKLFAFESYKLLVQGHNPSDLINSLSNGTLCMTYVQNYVALVTVESPTKSVTKSHRDQRKFFIDKLGVIGGTLGVSAGMSVLSMIEVLVLVYLVINGIFLDIVFLWKKVISYLKGKRKSSHKVTVDLEANPFYRNTCEVDELEEDQQQLQKLYVSRIF